MCDTHRNFRKEIFPAYKAHRKNKTSTELLRDKAVRLQKELMKEVLRQAGFPVLEAEGYEADDIMFNVVLHYAVHADQPLTNGMSITLHTSDEDWVGAMGLAPNIYYNSTVNQNRMQHITSYMEFKAQTGEDVEACYISRAMNGDNDGYGGFAKPFREATGLPPESLFNAPEVKENYLPRYWDSNFWKGIFQAYFSDNPELLKVMEIQTNLAFPLFMNDIYSSDITELISSVPNKDTLLEICNILRIHVLKTQIGELEPYNDIHERKLIGIKNKYSSEFQDVFDLYKQIEYMPEQIITTDQVEIAFGLTR